MVTACVLCGNTPHARRVGVGVGRRVLVWGRAQAQAEAVSVSLEAPSLWIRCRFLVFNFFRFPPPLSPLPPIALSLLV